MNTSRQSRGRNSALLTLLLLLVCCGCTFLLEASVFVAAAEDHEASTSDAAAEQGSRRNDKEFVQQHHHHNHPRHHTRKATIQQQDRTAARSWQPQDFPRDPADAECHSGTSLHFCDPDRILKESHLVPLEQALENNNNSDRVVHLSPRCSRQQYDAAPQEQETNVFRVQYGVALVRKMDLTSRSSPLYTAAGAKNPERAAELFARQIHDTWGVGLPTDYCGGTGILLFLSDRDRSLYISRGAALESVLTDYRLDHIIEHMKLLLRKQQHEQAILGAVQELDSYLAAGEPGWKERASAFVAAYMGYGFVFGIFGLILFGIHKDRQDRQDRREYAKISSQLSEMDQARAEALQGRFKAKSCPICLEDFTTSKDNDKADDTRERKENSETDNGKTDNDPSKLRGSDGQPLKLLRCGHVYCDSCFSDWVSSGHHNKVDRCPICQKDVREDSHGDIGHDVPGREATSRTISDEDAASRAYRQYTRDRNFRLMRLHRRYPRFIRQDQIDQWTRVGYNGSYARDPVFVACNPALRAQQSSGSHSGGGRSRSGGFGGGRSGGGRGGRW